MNHHQAMLMRQGLTWKHPTLPLVLHDLQVSHPAIAMSVTAAVMPPTVAATLLDDTRELLVRLSNKKAPGPLIHQHPTLLPVVTLNR